MSELSLCGPNGCTIGEQPGILLGHFGSDEADHDIIQTFAERFGQSVDFELKFIDFESGMLFTLQGAKTAAANDAVLFIKIEPWKGKKFPGDSFEYCKEINKGTFDDFWRSIGQKIRAYGRPVLLTFAHEANMEYRTRVYPWAAGAVDARTGREYERKFRQKAEIVTKAFMRVHDLISGSEKEGGGGANNVTWILNFDAGYYAGISPHLKRKYARQYGSFAKYIASRLKHFIPHDPKNPNKKYFHKVAFDFYINDVTSPQNRGFPKKVIGNYLDPFLAAVDQLPLLRDKEKIIGEFGVSLAVTRSMSKARKRQLQTRKAQLITTLLDYTLAYNNHPKTIKKIEGVVYFDIDKIWDPADQGFWKISSEREKIAGDALKGWFTANATLFKKPVVFYQNGEPDKPIFFQGPEIPIPDAKIDLSKLPEKQKPPADRSWDKLVPLPTESLIGEYNDGLGLPLLDRWRLEIYMKDKKEEKVKEEELEAGIQAFLKIKPEIPINFSLRSLDKYEEILQLKKAAQKSPESALFPYFINPRAYWENAVTFLSVYAQKAIEKQEKEKITKTARAAKLLLQRFENQKSRETGLPEKNYAYPSIHNLALLKLILADARSQLKDLDEGTYQRSIALSLEAVQLLQSLEKKDSLHPSGADHFSIVKALITIGDLKVRIAQIYTRKREFKKADRLFREAEKIYQAVADLDVGREKGITLDIKDLQFKLEVKTMLTAWENNSSKGYIRKSDKRRGFQGTFYFLRALAAIKMQSAFVENPSKKPADYKMKNLFDHLVVLQNSFKGLTRDPTLETDFIEGLASVIKANLLIMIGDRAQFDTISMDRASALEYFNRLLDKLQAIIPELSDAIKELRLDLIEQEAVILTKKLRSRRPALDFLDDLHRKVQSTHPQLADQILEIRRRVAAGRLKKDVYPPERVLTEDDKLLVDPHLAPFRHTAASAKRFALIMVQLVTSLAQKASDQSKPSKESAEPRFPYLYMISNLTLTEVGVRTFFITDRPFKPTKHLKRIETARKHLKPDDDWYRFQALYLEGNLLMLRSITTDYKKAVVILDRALEELERFIYPSRVFYKAQICLLQAQAYNLLSKRSGRARQKAKKVIAELTELIPEIENIAPEIGWNLKDFYVRYSRVVINSIARKGPLEESGFH